MKYLEMLKESNALVEERLALVLERLREIERSPEIEAPFSDYFKEAAAYLLKQAEIEQEAESGELAKWSAEEGKRRNEALYEPFSAKNYETSYANPAYANRVLGAEYGSYLCVLFGCIEAHNRYAFEGMRFYVCIYAELLVEIYNLMEDETIRTPEAVSNCIYSFMHDYSEVSAEQRVGRLLNPDWDYNAHLLLHGDLESDAYLYRFGLYVGENERKTRAFLATFSDEEIQAMADTYTEGYRIGFEVCNKDITKKSVVEIRYPLGFERMVRAAVVNFQKMKLTPVVFAY
jgi:hypothetical protein